jgi:large subunit ribosomal protein L17
MRHQKKTLKLGRTADHTKALLANQVCSLIEHSRIKTTLAKAKAVRPFAERMVTLGKRGSLHNRRTAIAYLHQPDMVKKLFEEIAPRSATRNGGYTRIIKLGPRPSDAAPMAYLEWVDIAPVADDTVAVETPSQKKAREEKEVKPAAESSATTGESGTAKAKKKRDTRSRATVGKARRTESKERKAKAAAQPKAKAKQGPKSKGRSGKKRA